METRGGSAADLERARLELRRLGYLDHGLERFLLQDALRSQKPWRTLGLLTAKVALLCGIVLAAALAAALAVANGSLTATPLDLPVLFLHLFPPLAAAVAAAFLLLGSAVLLMVRLLPVRRIEALALATALAAGLTSLVLTLWEAREAVAQAGAPHRLVLAAAAAVAAWAVVRLLYQGLLALAIRFTARVQAAGLTAWRWRRWVSGALLGGVLLLAVPVALLARGAEPPPAPLLPSAPGARVLLLGIDGVLPQEAEYLLRRGDLPAMAGLLGRGGELFGYSRPAEPPAAFWTSVATGLAPAAHGVAALDSFLPLGTRTPLARSGLLRAYWSAVEVPLHLAAYRPVLANRRSAFTVWELAARGGAPVAAVNWWATFPAQPLSGLVLAHDAYQLLRQGAAGAVSDPAAAPGLKRQAEALAPDGLAAAAVLAAALGPAERQAVDERAVLPDEFYRRVFAGTLAASGAPPRAAALYLPALDIAAAGWRGSDLAFADLVRAELQAADRLLAEALGQPGWGAVAVVLDPGRRGGAAAAGRTLLWVSGGACGGARAAGTARDHGGLGGLAGFGSQGGPGGRNGQDGGDGHDRGDGHDGHDGGDGHDRGDGLYGSNGHDGHGGGDGQGARATGGAVTAAGAEVAPEAVAAGLLRVLGLPQSAELPLPPSRCRWPEPPARVGSYGRPRGQPLPGTAESAAAGAEYLQNLRSLGYL